MFSVLGKRIVFSVVAILGLCWLFLMIWLTTEQRKFLLDQLRYQAEGVYHYIVLSRHWIASKGGIYVKEGDGYRLVTPSHFTKDVANYAQGRLPYRVKVAVLHAKNPFHIPDGFERGAILELQRGKRKEVWQVVKDHGEPLFRFAAPITFERECSNCHGEFSGNKVQGCISIAFPAMGVFRQLARNKVYLFAYLLGSLMVVFGLLGFLLKRSVLDPLNKFVLASGEIEEGDLGVRVDLQGRRDEWGKLAESFNKMVDRLARHHRELETEVERATRELSRAYDELKETERFRAEFFSNITHDLKTPITAIKGAVDLVLRKGGGKDPHVEIIRKNTEKLSKMISDLLDCARLESGQLELKREEGDLVETVEEAVLMAAPLAWSRGVVIRLEKGEGYLPVRFDEDRIFQVLSNLLSNGVKFSPQGKEVIVRVGKGDGRAVVSVEDFGPGIPEEEWVKVFEKFYRGEKGEGREGIGLGLAICKGIVEAHGGRIWISRPHHEGIVFSFSLPLEDKGGEDGGEGDTHCGGRS